MRAIIVDDERLARDEMKFLLEGIDEIEVVGEAAGGEEAVKLTSDLSPDLIFLDIQMPVLDGFGVIQKLLDSGDVPLVVFTTAYDQYAIRAFEVNAVDYLLKPIEKDRLIEAVDRVREALPRRDEFTEKLRKLTSGIKAGQRFLPKLVIRRGGGMELVDTGRVAMLERKGGEIVAHTDDGDFVSNYTDMDELEGQLDPTVFLRLGSDYIVNVRKISEVVPWSGGNYMMVLADASKTEIKLSRTQAQLLKNRAV
jgi:two-component system LytT family response regulator/two-component system response regulator LytT